MSIDRLRQLAEDFASVPPAEFNGLANGCDEMVVNDMDSRYLVVGRCLRISSRFFGPDDDYGAVDRSFYEDLATIWRRRLGGVLDAESEEEGQALANGLLDDIQALGNLGPIRTGHPIEADDSPERGEGS